MNFFEALQEIKSNRDEKLGIRPKSWAEHLTKRFLFLTGVDSHDMIGMGYYDFVANEWLRTWSVFCPTYYELEEEWEVIKIEAIGSWIFDNEEFILLMINCREVDEEFMKRYTKLVNNPRDLAEISNRAARENVTI
jgi:hypothetical protein